MYPTDVYTHTFRPVSVTQTSRKDGSTKRKHTDNDNIPNISTGIKSFYVLLSNSCNGSDISKNCDGFPLGNWLCLYLINGIADGN